MSKINAARVLMIASIIVIAAFQVYWLHKLYREEYDGLRRTTDIVFKETIYQLQASRLKEDSLFKGLPSSDIFSKDMIRIIRSNTDSLHKSGKGAVFISVNKTTNINDSTIKRDSFSKIFIRGSNDSRIKTDGMKIAYRFNDSLPVKSLDSAYSAALLKADIEIPFNIVKSSVDDDNPCTGNFCTTKVPVGIFGQSSYSAAFEDPQNYLWRNIATQVLLSLLVVLLTAVSFIFIYRNLLEHKRIGDIKNEFISNITHELKTPIATVTVAIEAMKNFNALESPERTKEYLDIADNELQRLSLLVDKVLKLTMFEQEQVEIKFEHLDLKKLVIDILSSMRIQFEKHHAQVQIIADDEAYELQADRLHLTSMFYNLIDNAVKYSPDSPRITVQLQKHGHLIRIVVQDNGVGISAEYRQKVFEKFFRVPGGNRHNVKGYGLGLSYVSHIVNKHHGKIDVQSEPGAGTSFIIELPTAHEKN